MTHDCVGKTEDSNQIALLEEIRPIHRPHGSICKVKGRNDCHFQEGVLEGTSLLQQDSAILHMDLEFINFFCSRFPSVLRRLYCTFIMIWVCLIVVEWYDSNVCGIICFLLYTQHNSPSLDNISGLCLLILHHTICLNIWDIWEVCAVKYYPAFNSLTQTGPVPAPVGVRREAAGGGASTPFMVLASFLSVRAAEPQWEEERVRRGVEARAARRSAARHPQITHFFLLTKPFFFYRSQPTRIIQLID